MRRGIVMMAIFALGLSAIWVVFPKVPIERLISHTQAVIKDHPNDANAHYILGRLYSLAFAKQTEAGGLAEKGHAAELDPYSSLNEPRKGKGKLLAVDRENARLSVAHYRKSVELKGNDPLYHFSLGWMEEQCAKFAPELGTESAREWMDQALMEFRATYRLALPVDEKALDREAAPLGPYLAVQAGREILEILGSQPGHDKEVGQITGLLQRFDSSSRAITPLIFSMTAPNSRVDELIAPELTVKFDLDGFADGRRWPWPKAGTCLLVWDPERKGQVTSGQDLFGSMTWWMFWRSGFEPLAALDDNRDGVLSGDELKGIAVWRDANGNGVADAGEVVTAEEFGIVEISVEAREMEGTLTSEGGIRMRDGRRVTVFDWVPRSVFQVEDR